MGNIGQAHSVTLVTHETTGPIEVKLVMEPYWRNKWDFAHMVEVTDDPRWPPCLYVVKTLQTPSYPEA